MATETAEPKVAKIYVWTKTERAGQIVTEDFIEGEFTVFTDGTRCRTSLINEMLLVRKPWNNRACNPNACEEPKHAIICMASRLIIRNRQVTCKGLWFIAVARPVKPTVFDPAAW